MVKHHPSKVPEAARETVVEEVHQVAQAMVMEVKDWALVYKTNQVRKVVLHMLKAAMITTLPNIGRRTETLQWQALWPPLWHKTNNHYV